MSEVECSPVNITRYRPEIETRCETVISNRTCEVRMISVPEEKCVPRSRTECETQYRDVEENIYKEECSVKVLNVKILKGFQNNEFSSLIGQSSLQ